MPDFDVVVIGAGAAGIAAARRLRGTHLSVRIVEARARLGGRAWTRDAAGFPLDLGCGWLHSADENEWSAIARELGFAIDTTAPPWNRRGGSLGWQRDVEEDFRAAITRFYACLTDDSGSADHPAADLIEAGNRWNGLLDAMSTWINGVELAGMSVQDWNRYRDTGVNWRAPAGYGALVAAYGSGLDVMLDCPARVVDHTGRLIRIETDRGALTARTVIIAVPTPAIAKEELRFLPALPDKRVAAERLPLGLADKLFLHLDQPEEFTGERRVFGATDSVRTGSYHLRPFGRPLIEGYFGGALARSLEAEGDAGFADFAISQLAGQFGAGIRKRLRLIAVSSWARDPFAGGSYSYAGPGNGEARTVLARPVDDRIFFAGEACSRHDFSTAHGAYRTGILAAESVLRALG